MTSSKDRILDSAERIVVRDGAAHLTLDAVAADAQLSKGGVLYHFPSKDALIKGMIARMVQQFEDEVAWWIAQDPNPIGRKSRAIIHAIFPEQHREGRSCDMQVATALIAAVANNPDLLDVLKESSDRMESDLLSDGIDPVLAMIIHMACDGIWLSGLFGITHPAGEMRDRVLERLRKMTLEGA